MKKNKPILYSQDVIDFERARAFEKGLAEGRKVVEETTKERRQAEYERLKAQSIDAIAHAITALARLVDGRSER